VYRTASSCLLRFRRVALPMGGLTYADATFPRCTCQHTQSSDLNLEAHFLVRLAAATFKSLLRGLAQFSSINFWCIRYWITLTCSTASAGEAEAEADSALMAWCRRLCHRCLPPVPPKTPLLLRHRSLPRQIQDKHQENSKISLLVCASMERQC
jgi:hypothetical protein